MNPQRTKAPSTHPLEGLTFRLPEPVVLGSGARMHMLEDDRDEVCRIEWVFWKGSWDQTTKLQAYTAIRMLPEGAAGRSSSEIAEMVQFHGAFLDERSDQHSSSLILYSLSKHLPRMLELVRELIQEPDFPEYEFGVMLNQKLQEFRIESEKVVSLARRRFNSLLFGENHPYGAKLEEEDFTRITKDDSRAFHSNNYLPVYCDIIVAGKLYPGFASDMERHFGRNWGHSDSADVIIAPAINPAPFQARRVYETKAGALQCAIRIGRPIFSRTHPDQHPFSVVNTLLGGYFGSRLMSNLREDKGYTYGVGSGYVSYRNAGIFFISSQVGAKHWEDALQQVRNELLRLIEEPVPEEELGLVKNYLWGALARAYDGPFARAERLRTYLEYGLNGTDLDAYLAILHSIDTQSVREIASHYLNPEQMIELIVGP